MRISEGFDLYKTEYMEFKVQARRIMETHEWVKRSLIQHLDDMELEQMTMQDIHRWHKEISKGRSINTVRNDLTRLRTVFSYLELRGIACPKSKLIPIPKRVDTVPSYLTPSEVERMIDSAYSLRNKFTISLLYSSGIRLSELIGLNRDQIMDGRFTVIGKGHKARLCFIDNRTHSLMKDYLSRRDDNCPALIISHLYRQRMTPTNVQLLIKNSAKRAGINKKVTPHTLRHSFATNFLQNNGNIRVCQVLLGHSNIATTMQYTHVTDRQTEDQYRKFHTL